ncbi:Hypothetical protein GLP15_1474 [Giardia lamblia P15]|uniref:Uncharacterized protein n=1 Tax=Giardia intestinalis (strain P15) TaxID=658858 RepID=E1EYR4_GIAIA|nr:Hypothetical protein GLP15_1474 [Giardia lamblia P15]
MLIPFTLGEKAALWSTSICSLLAHFDKWHDKERDFEDFAESPAGIALITFISLLLLAAILVAIIVPIVCIRRRKQAANYQAMMTPSGVVRKSRHPITVRPGIGNPEFNVGQVQPPTMAPSTVEMNTTLWAQPSNPTVRASGTSVRQTAALFPPAVTRAGS